MSTPLRLAWLSATVLLAACGPNVSFSTEARQVAPSFVGKNSAAQPLEGVGRTRAALEAGTAVNAMFQLLRDYQFPQDEGKVDMTNIYKVMHTADETLGVSQGKCAAITEQAVAAPFDLGSSQTYTCAGDDQSQAGYRHGFALKPDGSKTHALLTFRWAPDATQQRALGVLQGTVDGATHDVALTMVNLVEYPVGSSMGGATGDGFSLRTVIDGNSASHRFTLRALVASVSSPDNWTSLTGVGVSRGSGQSFLFKVWQGGTSPTAVNGRYFCLPASVGEAGLESVDVMGSATVAADCAPYAAGVDALVRLERAEAPLHAADFTGSDVGLSWVK